MRRIVLVSAALALAALLAGCGASAPKPTERYYDPQGLFSVRLPTGSVYDVVPGQDVPDGPHLVTGVLTSGPPVATSAAAPGFLGQAGAQNQQGFTIYEVYVVTTLEPGLPVTSPRDLASAMVAKTIQPDVQMRQDVRVDGQGGLLEVVDHRAIGYTDASAFVVIGGAGFWVRELFPLGDWGSHREEFLTMVHSLRTDVPPNVSLLSSGDQSLLTRSGTNFPLG
jgi:hypothetical protein